MVLTEIDQLVWSRIAYGMLCSMIYVKQIIQNEISVSKERYDGTKLSSFHKYMTERRSYGVC